MREPFVICTHVDSDSIAAKKNIHYFHAFLPRCFTPANVKWCLELCRLWFLSRGDGPPSVANSESNSDPDKLSELSDVEEEDENASAGDEEALATAPRGGGENVVLGS